MREIDERSVPTQQRRLYRARAEYALVLAATHGAPDRIRELARQAVDWYRRTGGSPVELGALERLAGATDSP